MIKIVAKSIDLLEYAATHQDGFRITDVVKDLEIPKSTAFNIIYTLVSKEMLEIKNQDKKIFTLGPKCYAIGIQYINKHSILDIVNPELEKLGNLLSSTVFMGTLDNNKVLYIFKYSPSTAVLDLCTIGTRADVYCTALGKSLVAFQEDFDFGSIKFQKYTENTILSLDEFLKHLDITKEKGYSIDNQEVRESVICVAAPIFNEKGKVEYAISTSSLYSSSLNIEQKAKLVINTANAISRKLGYNP